MPFTKGHLDYCYHMRESLSQNGRQVAILVIQYTLALEAVYPMQLIQCIGATQYVLSDLGKHPSQTILAGDSAGATLALSVVAHILHPHANIAPLRIKEAL